MRQGWRICSLAALLATVSPAHAQYGVPYGAPFGGAGLLTSPEAAGSVYGAGAAQQQQCQQTGNGRDGPRGVCAPSGPPDPRR